LITGSIDIKTINDYGDVVQNKIYYAIVIISYDSITNKFSYKEYGVRLTYNKEIPKVKKPKMVRVGVLQSKVHRIL
jgi:hypothetical protein